MIHKCKKAVAHFRKNGTKKFVKKVFNKMWTGVYRKYFLYEFEITKDNVISAPSLNTLSILRPKTFNDISTEDLQSMVNYKLSPLE